MKNLPKGWEIKKIAEICLEIFAGGDVPKENFSKVKTEEYNIPIFANGEKNLGFYGYTNIPKVSSPALTISGRGTIGFSVVRHFPFFPIVRLIVLIPNNETDLKFLKYSIDNCNIKHTGSSIPQLTVPTVKNIQISLPPLETQQRIVSKIEELFSELEKGVEELKKSLEQLKVYRQSVLKWAFEGRFTNENVKEGELPEGWEWKSFDDIIEISKNKYNPKENKRLFYVGLEHIEKNTGSLIVKENFEEIRTLKNQFYKGELLYGKLRPNLNKVYLAKEDGVCSTDILVLKTKGNCDLQFLKYLMLGSEFVNEMSENTNGVNLPRVSTKFILEYQIKIPKLNEQHQIVQEIESRLSVADKMEEQIKTSLQQAEALKQSILKKAFSGELVTGRV